MKRISGFMAVTLVLVVLLFSYHTSRGPVDTASPPAAYGDNQVGVVTDPHADANGSGQSGSGTGGSGSSSTSGQTVVNGTVAETFWGPVQVRVVIAGGRITDLVPLQYPTGNGRDRQINAYALPILRQRVLAAQSANIDAVSGATITSGGYIESVQAALDMAHFG
jgi:uncharacterized protein with FMN-binding domain